MLKSQRAIIELSHWNPHLLIAKKIFPETVFPGIVCSSIPNQNISCKSHRMGKESISLIPPAAVTEAECSSFLSALSKSSSGFSISHLTSTLEELSDVCRRNRNVQETS